ncbi:chromosome segregation protein SMC [Lagierella sp.]|uniref:chromosome segregation protein SMC n=1 Tax=Lagierella sp. TaxID=2849657 RepID=UPI00260F8D7B|nr:chromosome segregation protein SMC [Lagierella sp.]
MKLESVELRGFKSFKDRVNLQFNTPICAIVGPNGSGKSNISDGIRWVLGEQSAKSLRGNKMEDVIFSGTEKIAPLNYASVSLYFDNSEHWIPIDYEKVVVSRRVFRSGESEYYINKKPCRLKDVRELFMDTGIGKEGYSIIGQGRIDEILSNKSEDRRYIFEEASGISKYKYKKDEAVKKLEKTVNNLGRIEDVLIQKQENRDYLAKQAKKATIGLELSRDIKLLDLHYYLIDVDNINLKNEEILQATKDLKNEIDEHRTVITKQEPHFIKEEEELKELQNKIKNLKSESDKSDKELQNSNLKLTLTRERVKNDIKEVERLASEQDYFKDRIREIKEKSNQYNQEDVNLKENLKKSLQELTDTESEIDKMSTDIIKVEEELTIKSKKIEELRDHLNRINVERLTREKLEENRQEDISSMKSQKLSLQDQLGELKKDQDNFSEILKGIQLNLNLQEENLLKINDSIEGNKEKLDILRENFQKIEVDLNTKNKELKFFTNVRDNYEGYNRQVSNFLNRIKNTGLKSKVIGTLADLIEVDDKYLVAINNSLGGSLQNIVVEDELDAKDLIEFLKKEKIGRLTFLPLNKIYKRDNLVKFDDKRILSIASEVIKVDNRYKGLINHFLNKTLIVETLNDAIEVSKNYKGFRVVTLDGEIFNTWGSIVGGYSGKSFTAEILNRNNKIIELESEISSLYKDRETLKVQIDKITLDLKKSKGKLSELIQNKEMNLNEKKIIDERLQLNENDLKVKESLILELEKKLEAINGKFIDNENSFDLEDLNLKLNSLIQQEKSLNSSLEEARLEVNKFEIKKASITSKVEGMQRDQNILANNIKDLLDQEKDLSFRLNSNAERKMKLEVDIETSTKEISSLEDNLEQLKVNLNEFHEEIECLELDYENRFEIFIKKKDEISDLKNIVNKLEYSLELNYEKLQNLKVDLDRICRVVKDEYSICIDRFTLTKEVKNPSRKELKDLKRQLKNLGYFSVDTIEEFKIVDEDLNFLLNQKKDLLKSKEDIEEIISNLDKEMKEIFLSSFKDINQRFKKIFNILFDGGNAQLRLEGSDPLVSGVEIVAEPPGKKLQSLSLLSGGEKALTAVALLFAIFETRPSPFCILDEIDAALDEANITRYTNYLRSLTKSTQFIMISHRKTTMEIADVLYGVSMEEEGVSKVISLKLK